MPKRFAIATTFAPLLSTSAWREVFAGKLPLEAKTNLLRKVETIAFPGTKFIIEEMGDICAVTTREYPDKVWVDARFLQIQEIEPLERKITLPSRSEILAFLREEVRKNTAYIWGGNFCRGIPELLKLYPPSESLDENSLEYKTRILQGADCSGLLFEATNGFLPRNTSQLLKTGKSVPIQGLSLEDLLKILQPLDLIVWQGHVVMVGGEAIESRHPQGVIATPLKERFLEILKTRSALNEWEKGDHFVIRRWFPE